MSVPQNLLTFDELAKRLNVTLEDLEEEVEKGFRSFYEWSQEKDPDDTAWFFLANTFSEWSFIPFPKPQEQPRKLIGSLDAFDLASRLNVTPEKIVYERKKGQLLFKLWSRERDPDLIAWEYAPTVGKLKSPPYRPCD